MEEALYLTDAYLKEFDCVVVGSDGPRLILNRTAFYPGGGGQPADRGTLIADSGAVCKVTGVEKSGGHIVHLVEGSPLLVGENLHGTLDWALRYAHMRYHTCLHILSGAVFHKFGSVITGNQIYPDRARMDLSITDLSPPVIASILEEVNGVVARNLPVSVRSISRKEAEQDPSLVRVAKVLAPELTEVRLIDIEGFDVQADGGTHVASTGEVGKVTILKTENKGSRNKRLTVSIPPP